ncbi:hypothetical protein BESB_079400 [Besnoitia besnoiti]|uniref:DUF7164 domain-containing protein n=1 Tax=Besnoitia besnoiti TaxID=94643 RepID=A0A2A9M954_BESBE|nr:hypothetical protein BESB_079400 [Besnoitia besnoiti]PFH33724.1 hypothetical protein BESB_079400 [Besnoitia besnoiti]
MGCRCEVDTPSGGEEEEASESLPLRTSCRSPRLLSCFSCLGSAVAPLRKLARCCTPRALFLVASATLCALLLLSHTCVNLLTLTRFFASPAEDFFSLSANWLPSSLNSHALFEGFFFVKNGARVSSRATRPQGSRLSSLDERLLSCPFQPDSEHSRRRRRRPPRAPEAVEDEAAASEGEAEQSKAASERQSRGGTLSPAFFFHLGDRHNEFPALDFVADLEDRCELVRTEEQRRPHGTPSASASQPRASSPSAAVAGFDSPGSEARERGRRSPWTPPSFLGHAAAAGAESLPLISSSSSILPPPASIAYTRALLSRLAAEGESPEEAGKRALLPGVDFPATRVFVLYVPHTGDRSSMTQIDQAFGFIESWRYAFSVSQNKRKEIVELPDARLPPDFSRDALTGENLFFASSLKSTKHPAGNGRQTRDRWRPVLSDELAREEASLEEHRERRELHSRTSALAYAPGPPSASPPAPSLPSALPSSAASSSPGSSLVQAKTTTPPKGRRDEGEQEGDAKAGEPQAGIDAEEAEVPLTLEEAPEIQGEIGGSTALRTPVVNDVLIVVDPRVEGVHLPWICDELDALGGIAGARRDLLRRLRRGLALRQRSATSTQKNSTAHAERLSPGALAGDAQSVSRENDSEGDAQDPTQSAEKREALAADTPPRIGEDAQQHRCLVVRLLLDETQGRAFWTQKHPAMHSVSALTHPLVAWLLGQYDLALRSDNDAFLSPALVRTDNTPWITGVNEETGEAEFAFFTGWGGYNSETNRIVLPEYARLLKLRHQRVHNVGSTWYGRPSDVVRAARLSVKVGDFLMNADPVFVRLDGEWPTWYRGVLLLYAAEIAVNHLIDRRRLFVRKDLLDTSAAEKIKWTESPGLHIHCWHTPDFFSKHRFGDGGYDEKALLGSPDFDFEDVRWYAFLNASNGKRRRELQQLAAKRVAKRAEGDILAYAPLSRLLESVLVKPFSSCPLEKPHAVYGGRVCCVFKKRLCMRSKSGRQTKEEQGTCCKIGRDAEFCVLPPCRDWTPEEAPSERPTPEEQTFSSAQDSVPRVDTGADPTEYATHAQAHARSSMCKYINL